MVGGCDEHCEPVRLSSSAGGLGIVWGAYSKFGPLSSLPPFISVGSSPVALSVCRFPVRLGCVMLLSGLHFPLGVLSPSWLAGILGELGTLWVSPAHMCLLPSSQKELCGGHQPSLQNMWIYWVLLWLSPLQNFHVKFLGSPQVCGLPPLFL